MLVIHVCACSWTSSTWRSKKEFIGKGEGDLIEINEGPFEYQHKSNCGICGKPLKFALGYSKKRLLEWAIKMTALELRNENYDKDDSQKYEVGGVWFNPVEETP
jgi:hypothetical protein